MQIKHPWSSKRWQNIEQLRKNVNGKLKEVNNVLKEFEQSRISNLVEKYAKSIFNNTETSFPQTRYKISESFGIFDIGLLPMSSSPLFCA